MSLTERVKRRVQIHIDRDALRNNLQQVKNCAPLSRVFCVLKSDAYGHGAVTCAEALDAADGFAVVHPDEAAQLRTAGVDKPILVLQGFSNERELRELQKLDCAAVVHDVTQARLLETVTLPGRVDIWLKFDTGMGRLGFAVVQAARIKAQFSAIKQASVIGVMSHFACADETGNEHTNHQLRGFEQVRDGFPAVPASIANSAAVLAWPGSHLDWVRPGIMLYGVNPLDVPSPRPLHPVMRVTAPLIARKRLRRGDGVGYGQSYICAQDMDVGYAAIGYGDGLPRVLHNARVQIGASSVPVIGRVSMDSIALDLREVQSQQAQPGQPVTIWGDMHSVSELAHTADTIGYELLCCIRGHRRYD